MILCLVLTFALAAFLTACREDAWETGAEKAAGSEGKVFNICCWNEEFRCRIADHYPGYEEVDANTGRIGDVAIKWIITPNQDDAYQKFLDESLLKQADATADDKIDIFLTESDYALKYVDTEFTAPLSRVGVTAADLPDQYKYTQDAVTDSSGNLKGASWQSFPAVMIYNREIAKDVLGTDDPEQVQKAVKDWDTFNKTSEKVRAGGYKMTSTVNDTYRVYSNNVSSKWVVDGKVHIDPNMDKWVDDSKALVDAGLTGTQDLWSDEWAKGFYPEGKVFCYFGSAWFINLAMAPDKEGSIAHDGGWGAVTGPQSFFWGGSWICAAEGTDNPELIKDIILKMTADKDILKAIVTDDHDFVNNRPLMEEFAADPGYGDSALGGQNPIPLFCSGADTIDLSNLSYYDQGCNEEFQHAMKNYFEGNATKEEAVDLFYKAVKKRYPELTTD
ncbi:MAG: ABC transporter substrate-binding protein [Lachnospiraceae bacterium]|nr:ABC transporter substrate-binding protein [Lachnospiraceae bacterium]